MAYGVAVHGAWCNAKTYPTRCRFCGDQVFYFECNCGSKVFFSALGDDWPEHRCLAMLRTTYGDEFVEAGMAQQMMKHPGSRIHTKIEKRYEEALKGTLEARRRSKSWIKKIEANRDGIVSDLAVVKDISEDVDIFSRLRIPPDSSMAKAFLGILGRGLFGQVTFHVGYLPRGEVESYTAFVSQGKLSSLQLRAGDIVRVEIKAISVGTKHVWLCTSVRFED